MDQPSRDVVIGGTLRLNAKTPKKDSNLHKHLLAQGLLSCSFEVASATSKLIQKLMVFGSLEVRVAMVD